MPFDLTEAKTLIAIAANLEGATPPLALPLIPANWQLMFDSPVLGVFDNKWQLWASPATNQYAVVIRGTVDEPGSIIDDLLAVMIPASGTLPVGSVNLPYQFAADPDAAVHLGFALATGILLFDGMDGILSQLLLKVPTGAQVFITGHSQGAAIATLCRSFLAYSPILANAGKKYTYKTYLYAQPKPGDDHYGWDFERVVSNVPSGYCITNTQDWVPQVPLTLQLLGRLNTPNPLSVLTGGIVFDLFSTGIKDLRAHLAEIHLDLNLPQVKALEKTLQNQNLQATSPNAANAVITIVPTLNFVNCGAAITLTGTPGLNPTNPKDFFWQHHASMYYQLLCTVFP